ncbi:MAG: hypothetical protein ACI37N_06595 [Prevotella sp.]
MKKYILPFMSIAMLMAMASCSSSDDEVAEIKEESKLVPMTFTATQESNVGTRTALSTGNSVIWKTDDKISVFDGKNEAQYNHVFTLSSGNGSISGSFTGEVNNPNTTFYAVYPYTVGAKLEVDTDTNKDYVSGITLPSTQTAYKDSFDPNAALMIAKSSDKNNFNFLNVVSLVKVTTKFDCKRIVLNANEDIAGTGELYWDDTDPYISFTSNTSMSIVLKPQEGQDKIAAGTYYIAVKPGTLASGWSISFTSTDYNVYTRKANSGVTFNRGYIRSIGTFNAETTNWNSTSRGSKVQANQEVDLGLTITKDGTNYRVIFANANLTIEGLADDETKHGDYFAWGATEPWYLSISGTDFAWNDDYSGGYTSDNYNNYINGKSIEDNYVLNMEYDAARKILGGDWQIPTQAIWNALVGIDSKGWDRTEKGYKFINNNQTLFLPAAGYVNAPSLNGVDSFGLYWSGTASSSTDAYRLYFNNLGVVQSNGSRCYGYSVRPVRLVAE